MITATADSVFYSSNTQLVREDFVVLRPEVFRQTRTVFAGGRRINFRPEIGKFFNPNSVAPSGIESDETDRWSIDCFGLAYRGDELVREMGIEWPPCVADVEKPKRVAASSVGPGAKADALRWEQFAAAFAALADRQELDLQSENKTHACVANFLAAKGHGSLGIDTVRPLIRRFKAWQSGYKFHDDSDDPAD